MFNETTTPKLEMQLHNLHFGFVQKIEELHDEHVKAVGDFLVRNAGAFGIDRINSSGLDDVIDRLFKYLYPQSWHANIDKDFVGEVKCHVANMLSLPI